MAGSTPMINAAIVGVQRAGTSSLAAMLAEHPEICLAEGKEAHLFDDLEVQSQGPSPDALKRLFAHRRGEAILLDATPSYVWMPGCLEALARHNPEVKVICVLREPAERAASSHALQLGRGWEDLPFWRALLAERRRLRRDPAPFVTRSETRVHSYRTRGYYAGQVRHLLEVFPDALVLSFGELLGEPEATMQRSYEHLGLEPPTAGGELRRLNAFSEGKASLAERYLRLRFRREVRRTEELLGWPRGKLAAARANRVPR